MKRMSKLKLLQAVTERLQGGAVIIVWENSEAVRLTAEGGVHWYESVAKLARKEQDARIAEVVNAEGRYSRGEREDITRSVLRLMI